MLFLTAAVVSLCVRSNCAGNRSSLDIKHEGLGKEELLYYYVLGLLSLMTANGINKLLSVFR